EQRAAFVGHELEGRSFKELAAQAGVSVNAMVLRKHHSVLYLRRRLQAIRNEFLGERGEKMRRNRFARAARFILFGIGAALALTFVSMSLWNWLMPPV